MVQQAAGILRGSPTRVTSLSVTPETTGNEPVPSGPYQVALTRLETIESSLRGQGFQETCLAHRCRTQTQH